MIRYINRITALDYMIKRRGAGNPQQCAQKLGISERALFETISEMKEALGLPIEYCRDRQSYYYTRPGFLKMGFSE